MALTDTKRKVMMASHHHSCPVVVAMPLRCVKHPGPVPPPTTASGRSPLCICKMEALLPVHPRTWVVRSLGLGGFSKSLQGSVLAV